MVPYFAEGAARTLVISFLKRFITAGCISLLEDGGTVLTFDGVSDTCTLKVVVRVHNSQFYWKLATQADLGFADAYINGDVSFVDQNEGLLNFFLIIIACKGVNSSGSILDKKRGWWRIFTAGIASGKYFYQHLSRRNTLTQARRNIARHYDLSNEMFSMILDETMTYSCAVFKSVNEDLEDAQLRKLSAFIKKGKIADNHEVLEIGCGWGSFAIEVVKQTGCRYTGITLSEEQLTLAEARVKELGLQDRITFLLLDYRLLPDAKKYDRIISCEMIEHVGHDYIEEFFSCCESALAEHGLLILQFTAIPDSRYDEYRRSSDFITEYIFPGGCLPSLSRVTTAMASTSTLCVEHVENIGIHYHQTLRCWRENFLKHQRKVHSLGFDVKFIRTWKYYFDYCAAGFKSRTLLDYQIVLSRPGNSAVFNDPYEGIPSAYSC